MIDKISKSRELVDILTPKKTHMIHGDFHFDNILIDPNKTSNFILIDTRGESKGFDYAYDLGKLWHSFHGMYGMIHKEEFDLKYRVEKGSINVTKFKLKDNIFINVCNEIYEKRNNST